MGLAAALAFAAALCAALTMRPPETRTQNQRRNRPAPDCNLVLRHASYSPRSSSGQRASAGQVVTRVLLRIARNTAWPLRSIPTKP